MRFRGGNVKGYAASIPREVIFFKFLAFIRRDMSGISW
jgi:hypothetical protein